MNTTRAYLLALLAVPLTLGAAIVADDLAFRPAKDLESQKELRVEAELRIRDASLTFNGEPVPGDVISQVTAQEMLLTLSIDVTEKFLATKDGAPTDLLRTYDAIDASFEFGDEAQEAEGIDELEGKTVRFRWSDEGSEFKKSFHESKGDDSLLESLIDDMEVRTLLPAKKVSTGDTWEISGDQLSALFFPGGLPGSKEDGGSEGPDMEALTRELGTQLEEAFRDFKVACTYKGTREVAGQTVGEITFRYDGKASLDLGSMMRKVIDSMGEETPELDLTATANLKLDGQGALLWDLKTGVLHSYEMKADVSLAISVDIEGDMQGQSLSVALAGTIGGDVTWELSRK